MLGFLFQGLTAEPALGSKLFSAATAEARRSHWFVEGLVPDTLDGRFAMLATIVALLLVRFEQDVQRGNSAAVALTERFIEVMESEHRELGLGDPKLGRTVRKLVGALARRTGLWRSVVMGQGDWIGATRESLYRSEIGADVIARSAALLRGFWSNLERRTTAELLEGRLQ
jgi:cytochrome b pre-mRNA-processing protein 3